MRRPFFAGLCVVSIWGPAGCSAETPVPGVPAGTTWSYSEQIGTPAITQADLLLVVSNAPSMRPKQELLIQALPTMLRRLLWPDCIDSLGNIVPAEGSCPEGTERAFELWRDLRVGVITSSLGGHGSDACPRDQEGKDDRALFIPKVRTGVPDPEGTGFLEWRGDTREELEVFISNVQAHVAAVGTSGCDAPAPLEAFYRALVDTTPPLEVVVSSDGASSDGVSSDSAAEPRRSSAGEILLDEEVLTQRESFLRPASVVSIVVVSDHDDCSLMDGGVYENAGQAYKLLDFRTPMARPTSVCAENPNDPCCFSCSEAEDAPPGCDLSACSGELPLPPDLDRPSVRCFDTKRRFGADFSYPIERYVDGLSRPRILDDESGELVDNPLLRGVGRHAGHARDPGVIFFTGILGVPWPDVATDQSLHEPQEFGLRTARELDSRDIPVGQNFVSRWDLMLGDPGAAEGDATCESEPVQCGRAPIPPLDPFLIPSIDERPAGRTHPLTRDVIVASDSANPLANNINGHESNPSVVLPELYPDGGPARDRLQASCLFPLSIPLECKPEGDACLCSEQPERSDAACTPLAGGESGSTQYFGEAYPAPRILQVLRDFGENSIVAPICPKITSGASDTPSFGFNPALEALTARLPDESERRCLPRKLSVDEEGRLPCVVVEARPQGTPYDYFAEENENPDDPCALAGRSNINPTTRHHIESLLRESGRCDGAAEVACKDYHLCALEELTGEARRDCLTEPAVEDSGPPGYCYIDPSLTNREGEYIAGGGIDGENRLVTDCPASSRRDLRFVGEDTPRPNSVTFVACQMVDLSSSADPGIEDLLRLLPFIEPRLGPNEIPPEPDLKEVP